MSWRLERLTDTDSGASPICFCHATRSSAARCMANRPSCTISPQLSATGMKSAGGIEPRRGCSHLQQRLEAGDGAVFEPHDRLVGEREFLALDGAPQVGFELQPIGADRAEGRPERLDAVAAEALGLMHGELGILDHVLGGRLRLRSR